MVNSGQQFNPLMETRQVKRSQIVKSLEAALKANVALYIAGQPGVGKSSVVHQVAKAQGYDSVLDMRLPLWDPTDFRGVPSVVPQFCEVCDAWEKSKKSNGDGTLKPHDCKRLRGTLTRWNPPESFPREGKHIFFLDELPNAPVMVQSAALQLVLDHKVGEYTMPEDCRIVAAGNRVTDRAGAGRLIASLADRFVHVDFEPDPGDWCDWALDAGIETPVLAFIRFRPTMLSTFDPAEKVSATPRSWEKVSRLMPYLSPEIEFPMIEGVVGKGPATEFVSYLKVWRNLPDLDSILLNPKSAPTPSDPAVMYALCTGLATRTTDDTAESIIIYAKRLRAEFSVLLVQDSLRRNRVALTPCRAYVEWVVQNREFLG